MASSIMSGYVYVRISTQIECLHMDVRIETSILSLTNTSFLVLYLLSIHLILIFKSTVFIKNKLQ